MVHRHVGIDPVPVGEGPQTNPANMSPTSGACNVITTFCSLDDDITPWAVLGVVSTHPLFEQSLATILIWTRKAVVIFDMAVWADPNET
jgi:hypothetical protein